MLTDKQEGGLGQGDVYIPPLIAVGAVHHYNGTMITFATEVAGHEVRVWNGEAYLMANGDRFELCENDVGCSAFQVDDAVSADRILNLAIEELVAAGYRAEGEALRRRRLQTGIGECDVVEDQLAQLLNTPPSPPPTSRAATTPRT